MSPSVKFYHLRCLYFPSAAAILLLFSKASYKERRCKLFVSSERYVRTAAFSTSSFGCTRMYWIPKSSPGCRASSLAVILPPAIPCTLLFPSPGRGYSQDKMFRPSHAQELPFPWSLCVYPGRLKEFAVHKHKHKV